MRAYNNVLRALVLLAWSAVSLGQQQGAPPAPRQPEPRAEAPAPPPAAEPEAATPPREPASNADEGEFIPTEELAPDSAITFPVNI